MLWKFGLEDFSDESCALKLVENVALPTVRLCLGIPMFAKLCGRKSSRTQRLWLLRLDLKFAGLGNVYYVGSLISFILVVSLLCLITYI